MGRDNRDDQTWVVLELTRTGEQLVELGEFEGSLLEYLSAADPDHLVFVPSIKYTRHGQSSTVHLMEGYAFVASGLHETDYFALEHECPYVRQVLTQAGGRVRTLKVVPQSAIDDMKRQLADHVSSDIEEGMEVLVTEGLYSSLTGEVLILTAKEAHVLLELRSLRTIQMIPRAFLTPADESDQD